MRYLDAADGHIGSPLRGPECYAATPIERLCNAPTTARERLVDEARAETRGHRGADRHRTAREASA
jgi:hypothetical protein